MAGLLDLGSLTREVIIRNADGKELKLKVRPVTAETIFALIWRFQTFRALMEGDLEKLEPKALMGQLGPMALAAIMVQCTGGVREPTAEEIKEAGGIDEAKAALIEKAEDIARYELSADAQSEILLNVFEMSFREGVGPFVERIQKLIKSVGPQGLERASSLLEESFSAVQMDVHLPKSGKKLQGKYSRGLNS